MTRYLQASALALLAASPALAQEITYDPEVYTLDEIVLIANRTPLEADRTGSSVAVLDEDDLRKAGAVPLTDILARLPGVSVTRAGGFGTQATLRVRGADSSYVPVYMDGILITDPSLPTVSLDFGRMTTQDIGRVELLSGSQSALYGGSAVGGVIAITTKRAQENGQRQSVAAELGSNGYRAASYGFAQKSDRMEHAFNISHLHTDGISAASAGTERDGAESSRLSYTTRYQLNDRWSVGGAALHQRSWADYDGFGYDADNRTHVRETGGRVFAEYDDGQMSHLIEATRYEIDRRDVASGFESNFSGKRSGFAYRGQTEAAPGVTLLWGADSTRETADSSALPKDATTRVNGAFIQGIWTPRDGVDVSASVRHDHNSDFGNFTSARLAVAAQLGSATTLRAAIGNGFRAPSLDERFGTYDFGSYGTYIGNPDLRPEESLSAEIGLDHQFSDRGHVSATLFRIETDELIDYDYSSTPFMRVNLPGRARRQGVELDGAYSFGQARLSGSYSYIDARDANDTRLLRVPRHDLTLGVEADFGTATTAGASLHHMAGLMDYAAAGAVEMPSYTLVDATVSHDFGAGRIAYARVENLFDRDYEVINGYNAPGRTIHVGLRADF